MTQDAWGMYLYACAYMRVYLIINIYGVGYGVVVCYKGSTRASIRGTARLQSRFRFYISLYNLAGLQSEAPRFCYVDGL